MPHRNNVILSHVLNNTLNRHYRPRATPDVTLAGGVWVCACVCVCVCACACGVGGVVVCVCVCVVCVVGGCVGVLVIIAGDPKLTPFASGLREGIVIRIICYVKTNLANSLPEHSNNGHKIYCNKSLHYSLTGSVVNECCKHHARLTLAD